MHEINKTQMGILIKNFNENDSAQKLSKSETKIIESIKKAMQEGQETFNLNAHAFSLLINKSTNRPEKTFKTIINAKLSTEKQVANSASSNKLQALFKRELKILAEEPEMLKEAIVEWKEKKGHEIQDWKHGEACTKKCEYTDRSSILEFRLA